MLAVGADLVDVMQFARTLSRHDVAARSMFSSVELANARNPKELALIFATKEAVLKAIGSGFAAGTSFLDVEVHLLDLGRAEIHLSGRAKTIWRRLGLTRWMISTASTDRVAVAVALAFD
jgi:holo-[acyl-carrier protein] synthase